MKMHLEETRFASIQSKALAFLLAFAMVFTMMPVLGLQQAYAASSVPGGVVTADTTDAARSSAKTALSLSDSDVTVSGNTLNIKLNKDVVTGEPVRFVLGTAGKKVVLDLNGHTITGRAGSTSSERSEALGGNAIEIAADEFDVEIRGAGAVIGGKGGKWNRPDYRGYRVGVQGGSAVFFCERVDKVHGVTENWGDIIDEGYHPDKLEHGLSITGGAELVGGAGADVTLEDWKYNLSLGDEDLFSLTAGKGGSAIGQIFSDTATESVLEELSYAKIIVENGTVTGGAGGGVNLGDQLLTTTDIQKISEIQQLMKGKDAGYDFDSNVKDNMKFKPANGGNGIEFYAGRKYIEVGSSGTVAGGTGGKFSCSEKASMVKNIDTTCGSGGIGICVRGDTGLTNTKPSLTADSWSGKNRNSDDVGIYIAGKVTGGASPSTTLRSDSCGAGGEGIDCDLDGGYLCEPYTVESGHRPTFDADRGIVLVDAGGKVAGGAAGAPNETNISGGLGADAVTGGSTGGPTASVKMSAAYFIINGEAVGGYGSSEGGSGFHMKKEMEYYDDTQSSAYFGGAIYGRGAIRGGDSGEWPNIGTGYTADSNRVITYHGNYGDQVVRAEGISLSYGSHEEATAIGSELSISDGEPAKLMTTSGTFSVTPSMTPFATGKAPDSNTKLSCTVKTPNGYNGKVYIMWSAEYESTTPRSIRVIEGANGAYNNFGLLSNSDYPYGWKADKYTNYTLYTYHINVATTDHIAESIKYNDNTEVHIYCHVLLEDGRFIDNDDIWFSKERRSSKGWGGSSGGGDDDQQEQAKLDQEAADAVIALIEDLPSLSNISLEDEEAVKAARSAYDALTQAQKDLLAPYVYLLDELQKAEAKIRELKGDADKVQAVVDLIEALADEITDDNAEAEAGKIAAIRTKIEELDAGQLELLQQNEEAMAKLRAAEEAVNAKLAKDHEHLMCHVPAKAATCSVKGNIEYYFCILCSDGKHYEDAEGKTEITGEVETDIDETRHVIQLVPERAATCSSTGVKEHYECAACGKLFDDKNGTIEITDPSILVTAEDSDNHTWWRGNSKTTFYTDYYKIARTDLCTGCGKSKLVAVTTFYKGGLPTVKAAKPKVGKKKFTAKWKKVSKKNQKKMGGIEIQVKGTGLNKIFTAGKSKTSKTIKVPKAKTKYKYRVRAYKGTGTAKQVSKWSGWKTAKVK